MKKSPLLVIFLTVFIDLIGFGIVLPMLPLYSDKFGASGFMIGVIMASFSAMQFFFAPAWGRLSDRIGRRPVMLTSTGCAVASYAFFAFGSGLDDPKSALAVIVLSRVLAGICGANITVAQACIADVTPPESRSKKMGLVGMAFGLGFIFGPALGALSIRWLGETGPGWVAASLCAANFLLALKVLPETRNPEAVRAPARAHWEQWRHTLSRPAVGLLVVVFFLGTFCFTCFETTLTLLVARNFHLIDFSTNITSLDLLDRNKFADAVATGSILFVWCGVIGAFVQGGPLGKIVKRFGEMKLIVASLLLVAASMAALPFIHGSGRLTWGALTGAGAGNWWLLLLVLAALSIGSSLSRPPIFGLISILTPAGEQGATLGVAQGAGSVARIAGPVFAAALYDVRDFLPYVICAGIAAIAALIAWAKLHPATGSSPGR